MLEGTAGYMSLSGRLAGGRRIWKWHAWWGQCQGLCFVGYTCAAVEDVTCIKNAIKQLLANARDCISGTFVLWQHGASEPI